MLTYAKKRFAEFNRLPTRFLCMILVAVMLLAAIPLSLFNVFANDGGFQLSLKWMGNDNTSDFVYDSVQDEAKLIRLRVGYRNESPTQGYNKGELVITVNGLGGAVRNGTATPAGIAADLASAGTNYYDWSYTYSSSTDTYTFTNNKAIPANNTLDGMFEIIWNLPSRATVDDFSNALTAKLRTAYQEQTTSNTVTYSQSRTKDDYTVSHAAKPLYGAEGLTDALPEGSSDTDYTWVNYSISGTDSYNSLDVSGTEHFDMWFLDGSIVQSPLYSINDTGTTRTTDGKTYRLYSVSQNITNRSINPYLEKIYVAYPKAQYENQIVNSYIELKGTYYEDSEESLLASHKLTINLADFGYQDIPGSIYNTSKYSYGMHSQYIDAHCQHCYDTATNTGYGAISSESLVGGKEYSSNLCVLLNNKKSEYSLEFADDFLDVELKNGQIKQLTDSEYNFTKIVISGTNSLKNINGVSLASGVYPVEVYIRRAGAASFETTPYTTSTLTTAEQTVTLPDNTAAVKLLVKDIKESIQNTSIASVYYQFHTTDSNIRTDNGKFYNNMYFKLYDKDGNWLDGGYKDNPGVYGSDREYQRDMAAYGTTMDREYNYNHILEVPNEFTVNNSLNTTGEDRNSFFFTGSITSNLSYLAGGNISGFSQYTILPEDMILAENIHSTEIFLNTLSFSSSDSAINDGYIREHCTAEIIDNYKDSGRTYIALHYDFKDAPVSITRLTASGIPMYVNKSEMTEISKTYTMYAEMLVDASSGKWYAKQTDANSMEGDIWSDIDRDGNTVEQADFDYSQATVFKALSAQLAATKAVASSSTGSYVSPDAKDDGSFADEDIPTQYLNTPYSYSISLSAGQSQATNVVLCDVLEKGGEWQGTLQSIDYTRAARLMGTEPTVYYSTQVETISPEPNLTSGGWTTVKPATVKSIALDFGTASLPEGRTLTVYFNMLAPEDSEGVLINKISKNEYQAYYTPVDTASGSSLPRTDLPSNSVPLKLVPFMGTIRLNKTDAVDGRAVFGAKFSLYEMLGDNPDKETDRLVDNSYVTNANGLITTGKLIYGEYYFVETEAASGYLLPENEADRITRVTLDSDEPDVYVSVAITNERKPGQFTLLKVNDRDETIKVSGAVFSLFKSDGTPIQTGLTTDDNGELTVNGVDWGDYYLLETAAPKGYDLYPEKIAFSVSADNDSGSTLSLTIKDPQKPASAVLTKYEMLEDGVTKTQVTLDGAVYELHYVKGSDDKVIGTYMTDDDGKIHADDLAFGRYYFKETIAALGYEKYPNNIPFTVDADHTVAYCDVTTTDARLTGNVWLQKTDDDKAYVKNAEYGLYNAGTDELIETYKTNDEGVLEINGIYWGDYYLLETKAPTGYELDSTKHIVTVNRQTVNNKVIIEANDPQAKGSVTLLKVSEEDESIKLPGAVFSLYKSDGSLVQAGLTTGADGTLTVTDLNWGSYYFEETAAPAGYGLNESKIRFSVNYLTGGKTQEITVTDPEISLELKVIKKIKTADIVFAHGNPTFTFKLSGTDINGNTRVMYKTVTFSAEYYEAHKADEYLAQAALFGGLLSGSYSVSETETNRYTQGAVTDITGGVVSGDGKSVNFDLILNETGSATFLNDKVSQEKTSHTSQVTNVVAKQRKLTSITAVWNGGEVTSETLDRTKLDVYANYDDGTSAKLADDVYTLDPTVFDPSMNGDYTVTASYTEGGVTRKDGFQLTLNVVAPFTWTVLTEEPYEYDGKTYDGTVAVDGYYGKSTVVKFPSEVSGSWTFNSTEDWTEGFSYNDNGKTYRVVQIGSDMGWYRMYKSAAWSAKGVGGLRDNYLVDNTGTALLDSEGNCIPRPPVTDVIIPEGVVTIYDSAFNGLKSLENVTIPSTVKTIGNEGFRYNWGLKEIPVFPQGLETIGDNAFANCTNTTGGIVIPDSVKRIGKNAFYNCSSLNGTLTLGTGASQLQVIDDGAFDTCTGLSGNLIIPDSVTYIGDRAFQSCGFNGTLTLGTSASELTTIGMSAFSGCKSFTGSLVIPDSVVTIDKSAFVHCTGFNGNLMLGTADSKLDTIGSSAFYECSGLTGDLVIPDSVRVIGDETIPDYYYAGTFSKCTGLTGTLTLGSNLEIISAVSFSYDEFTGSLVIPDKVTYIGPSCFSTCNKLTGSLSIPDSVKTIMPYAFDKCKGFNGTLTLGSSATQLTSIGTFAFGNCTGLKGNLVIPDTVKTIGNYAFYNCVGFKGTLTLGTAASQLTSIGDYAFGNCGEFVGGLTIPSSVDRIGKYAFLSCIGLNGNLIISDGVQEIGESAFNNCIRFTGDFVVPVSVTSIGEQAFGGFSTFVTSFKLPSGFAPKKFGYTKTVTYY